MSSPPNRPLRRMAHIARRSVGLVCRAWRQLPAHGGLLNALRKAWRLYCQFGLQGVYQRLKMLTAGGAAVAAPDFAAAQGEVDRHDYGAWLERYDSWPADRLAAFARQVAALPVQPRFAVRIVGGTAAQRARTEASFNAQTYSHWQMEDSAEVGQADWLIVLYPGVVLAAHALLSLVDEINRVPLAQLVYGDEDLLSPEGERLNPDFKPEWNPLLFYSTGWLAGMYAIRVVGRVKPPAFAEGEPSIAYLNGLLGVLEEVEPQHIHRIARVLVHRPVSDVSEISSEEGGALPPSVAGAQSLQAHLARQGVAAEISVAGGAYRLRYALPQALPLASIIIPTRNGLELMRQCVGSIVAHTTYPNYEILIVDNGSDDPAALAYFAELAQGENVRVLRDDSPFNYSALNNLAVKHARGDVLILMNNDIEVISPDWLQEMVSFVLRPEVGAVGARLLYPDGRVQHAGVMLGIRGVAGHVHKNLGRHERGYQGRAAVAQYLSAVTAACLAVRKSVWQQLGGLNESDLKVAFNDVDFCIRLVQAGYRNVWTPYAELFHHESVSRGTEDNPEKIERFVHEVRYMQTQWADVLPMDPAYNPALTLDEENFGLAWPPRYQRYQG